MVSSASELASLSTAADSQEAEAVWQFRTSCVAFTQTKLVETAADIAQEQILFPAAANPESAHVAVQLNLILYPLQVSTTCST